MSGDSHATPIPPDPPGIPAASEFPPVTQQAIAEAVERLRETGPLVQSITNIVVANFTANVLLAAGAAPAMIDNVHEAAGFAAIASGVLLNLGTPYDDTTAAMREAARSAHENGTPWVLDPVGAGGLSWRTGIGRELLAEYRPTILRGNASEILGLAGGAGGRGVDSTATSDDALEVGASLAREHGCVVAVSGETDVLADGTTTVRLANGVPMLTRVTGVGCALGSLMAAYASVASPLVAAAAAHSHLNIAGEDAARASAGPGSFAVTLLDALDNLTPTAVGERARIA